MRTHPAMQQGGKVLFREDFLNLARVLDNHGQIVGSPLISRGMSGGQVRYYVGGLAVAYAGAVTVLCHAIVASSGSDQALWSVGSAAARRMEVGINATGRPYVWGSAQVLVGEAIPDGHHDVGWSIDTSGNVTCVVDGELWGSGTVVFGAATSGWRMMLGGSVLGTLPWQGTVRPVFVYRGALTHEEMAGEMGVSDYFTPASVPNTLMWLRPGDAWWEYNTQPNLSMLASYWTAVGATLSNVGDMLKVQGLGVSAPYAYKAASEVTGNRYRISGYAFGDGTNGVPSYSEEPWAARWSGTNSTLPQVVSAEFTATGTGVRLYGSAGTTAGAFALWQSIVAQNLSLKAWRSFYGSAGGQMVQATATAMPWNSNGLVRSATSDYFTSSLAAGAFSQLHVTAGCAISGEVYVDGGGVGYQTAVDNCAWNAANVGVSIVVDATNTRLSFLVANGTGVAHINALTAAGTFSLGTKHAVTIAWSSASGYSIWIDGAAPTTGAVVGVASAANPTNQLYTHTRVGGNYLNGGIGNLTFAAAPSSANVALLHSYMRAKAGT